MNTHNCERQTKTRLRHIGARQERLQRQKASYETGVTMSAFEEELKPDIEASRIISDEVSMAVFCNAKWDH